MTKYEVFCTVFENWINNIMILTTENCTRVIKNIVFLSSMSIALDAIFLSINYCPGYGQIFNGYNVHGMYQVHTFSKWQLRQPKRSRLIMPHNAVQFFVSAT